MSKSTQTTATDAASAVPRWIDLYKIAAVTCILFPIGIILAVVAYFIWPYTPGLVSVADIFDNLHSHRLGGLVSLDLFMVLLMPVGALLTLAMYAALKEVNESYALDGVDGVGRVFRRHLLRADLQSHAFTKPTAYVGLVVTMTGLGIFVPGIGALLSLAATIGRVTWYGLMARDFYRLGWEITR
jgi:hypothetical protein